MTRLANHNPHNDPQCFVDSQMVEDASDFAYEQIEAIPPAVMVALDVLMKRLPVGPRPGWAVPHWTHDLHDLVEEAELARLEVSR